MARATVEQLEPFVTRLFTAAGVSEAHARQVAESLVAADLRGHTSHGVLRVPLYLDRIASGDLNPNAEPAIEWETTTAAGIDGHSTFGQVVGRVAVDTLTERAENGVGVVGLRDAAHLGRVGEWAERIADRGLLFAAFVNTGGAAQTVAPPGSADRRLSTNPIAFGVPTFDALPFPLVLDMATSQVAHGKIRERAADEKPLPPEWTTTADGSPERDADAFEAGAGALLPLGGRAAGYKGFGLAVVSELFAGLVGNAPVAGQHTPDHPENAAAFVAVDPLRFTTRDDATARITALADYLDSAESREEIPVGIGAKGDEALLPGEAEYRELAVRREEGVHVPTRIVDALREVATEFDVEPPTFED